MTADEGGGITTEALLALRDRQVAFLEARLVSAAAQAEWRSVLAAAVAELYATPVRVLVDAQALVHAVDQLLAADPVGRAVRPVAEALFDPTLAELRAQQGTLGDRLPPAVRPKIDRFLARPGLVPDRFIREVLEQDAVEQVLHDVLFDALRAFSEKVNPITLLKRLTPLGIGMSRGLDALKADFDKKMDPEIRKFLHGFSRQALKHMADVTIARWDDPEAVSLRKEVARWILARDTASLGAVDRAAARDAQDIALDVFAHLSADPVIAARRRVLLEQAFAAHADLPLGDALAALGVHYTPDVVALGAATWPALRAAFGTEAVRAWLRSIVDEFYATEIARAAETVVASSSDPK